MNNLSLYISQDEMKPQLVTVQCGHDPTKLWNIACCYCVKRLKAAKEAK